MSGAGLKTAEVEVLTAEVRVLMVGSRQITLSVARQLDMVNLTELIPFGRIRTREYDYAVIGKDRTTGTLVVATYHASPPVATLDKSWLPEPIVGCYHVLHPQDYKSLIGLYVRGWPVEVPREMTQSCSVHYQHPFSKTDRCDPLWNLRGSEKAILRRIHEMQQAYVPHEMAHELPLIVLAGLR